jgi:hypothetical protein
MPAILRTAALAAGLFAAAAAVQAADVGVSVQVSQPGVYGRIDIGRFPQPQVVVQQPVVVMAPRVVSAAPQPVYMWVPPGHQRKWSKHCHRYDACGVPVYFVEHGWYRTHVSRAPGRYAAPEANRRDDDGRGHGHGRKHGRHEG